MTVDLEGPRTVSGAEERVTLFGVKLRSGIWQVSRDGRFYGHYMSDQPAFDAAEAAARAVVAGGGAADVRWNDRRSQAVVSPIGVMRTMQFRAGSTRIMP